MTNEIPRKISDSDKVKAKDKEISPVKKSRKISSREAQCKSLETSPVKKSRKISDSDKVKAKDKEISPVNFKLSVKVKLPVKGKAAPAWKLARLS